MRIKYLFFCITLTLTLIPQYAIAEPFKEVFVYVPPELPVGEYVDLGELVPEPEYSLDIRENCYAYVESVLGDIPSMDTVQKTATKSLGNVAVFKYPPAVPHVAVVQSIEYGYFTVSESNLKGDEVTTRSVSFSDPALIGFINVY